LKNLTGKNGHAEADKSGKVEHGFDGDEVGKALRNKTTFAEFLFCLTQTDEASD
jgi:hypothetical protein